MAWMASFTLVFVLAGVIAYVAGDFSRGTFQALLQQPRRGTLLAGKLLAVLGLVAALVAEAMLVGWVTARLVAPGQGVDVDGWMSLDGVVHGIGDYGRVVATLAGWALLGTTIAVLVRSIPVALAIGVVWAGPIENVIGDS